GRQTAVVLRGDGCGRRAQHGQYPGSTGSGPGTGGDLPGHLGRSGPGGHPAATPVNVPGTCYLTRAVVWMSMCPFSHSQSMAARLTRAHPLDAGSAGTLV